MPNYTPYGFPIRSKYSRTVGERMEALYNDYLKAEDFEAKLPILDRTVRLMDAVGSPFHEALDERTRLRPAVRSFLIQSAKQIVAGEKGSILTDQDWLSMLNPDVETPPAEPNWTKEETDLLGQVGSAEQWVRLLARNNHVPSGQFMAIVRIVLKTVE